MAAEAVQEVRQSDLLKEDLLYVGKTITRIDSLEKVTGRSVYGVDFSLPHMLFGKFKRSDVPHAEILTIDTSRASKVSGVRADSDRERFAGYAVWRWFERYADHG